MKDQTNQKSKTTIVILTLQSSFECILAQFHENRHLRVMGTVYRGRTIQDIDKLLTFHLGIGENKILQVGTS